MKTKLYAEFVAKLQKHFTLRGLNYHAEKSARELVLLTARYDRLQETACNRNLSFEEIEKERRIEEQFARLSRAYELPFKFGGDPRGYTVKCFLADGSYNTWGGKEEGYGIPSSTKD